MQPSRHVVEAFGAQGEPQLLIGGQGKTYLVGNTVLKPAEVEEVQLWKIKVLNKVNQIDFRVPKYIKSKDHRYIVDGWTAYEYLPGEFVKNRWIEKRSVLEAFHKSLVRIPRPDFIGKGTDPWTIADKMVWGEIPIRCHKRIMKVAKKLVAQIKSISILYQIIQADSSHILFSENESPAIIDFSPSWRPAEFALAILVVDALVWEGANESIIDVFSDIEYFEQLLLRAELRRVLELEGLRKQYHKSYLKEVEAHIPSIELICKITSKK